MERLSGDSNNLRVLELGCGFGKTSLDIFNNYHVNVVGVEIIGEERVVSNFKKNNYLDREFKYLRGDIENLDFEDNSFDLVFSFWAFPYVWDKLQGLREVHRVFKLGGLGVVHLDNLDTVSTGGDRIVGMIPTMFDVVNDYSTLGQLKVQELMVPFSDNSRFFSPITRVRVLKNDLSRLVFPNHLYSEVLDDTHLLTTSVYEM